MARDPDNMLLQPVATQPARENDSCRQIRNFSPTRFMLLGGDQRTLLVSDLVVSSNNGAGLDPGVTGVDGTTQEAPYRGSDGKGDPYGYLALAPSVKATNFISPGAKTALGTDIVVMPPFTQVSYDSNNAPNGQAILAGLDAPLNQPTFGPDRVMKIAVGATKGCTYNVGVMTANQPGEFYQATDAGGYNWFVGAYDTPWGARGYEKQARATALGLAPRTGARFWGENNVDNDPAWGCATGCHEPGWGCQCAWPASCWTG
jgi:hypothetical protein